MRIGTRAVAFAIIVLFAGAAAARADTTCIGMLQGTVNGDVIVPPGQSCTLSLADVKGNVLVQNNASLLVDGYDEPSAIGGNVIAANCASALLEGNVSVDGNVRIGNCTGAGRNGFRGPGITIGGNFRCHDNAGPCTAWLGEVDGNLQVYDNASATSSDITLDTVGGNLACRNNSPAPTHSHGGNWVTGTLQQQCGEGQGFAAPGSLLGTAPSAPVASCADLAAIAPANFPVPNTEITSAVDTPAGGGLPERCIVDGVVNARVSPVDNCQYGDHFQVQLPLPSAWNHRFMFQGGGGTEGSVPTATGTNSGRAGANFGILNGYAVASQDGGHENSQLAAPSCDSGYGNANEFYLDPLGLIDQAYQSIQVTTIVAKYLIAVYYGDEAGHSYWVGCSTGGRQAMVMSQNFPSYFDGIIAGDPVYDLEAISLSEVWSVDQIYDLSPGPYMTVPEPAPEAAAPIVYDNFPASDQTLFETALLQACDALDGAADGVIDNLPACLATFNPATATYTSGGTVYPLQCTGPKNPTCLSPAQIQAVERINEGPRTDLGQTVEAPAGAQAPDHVSNTAQGYQYDGGWMSTAGIPLRDIGGPTSPPGNYALGLGQFPYAWLSPPDPAYDTLTFNFTADLGRLNKASPVVSLSTSADISNFIRRGNKIILYHGLSDPGPPVLGTILYYGEMAARNGGIRAAQKFSRLYLIPNMGHCGGGPATDQFDMLTPLTQWVENGVAPGPVPATGVNFTPAVYQVNFLPAVPTRSRPLCPYPQQARYIGPTGAGLAAGLAVVSNYQCIVPSAPPGRSQQGPSQ
jgi:hypothetical protein